MDASSDPAPDEPGAADSGQGDLGRDDEAAFPIRGRLLGVDFGTKRLGIAVCNLEQTISSPLENYTRAGLLADARHLRRLAEEYGAVGIVVGLPVHMSGDEGGKAREAREFGTWLGRGTGLPVRYADERFTSLIAEDYLLGAELTRKKRKARLDMLAAQLILRGYLERQNKTDPAGPV